MKHTRKLGPPIVASAVAVITVANFSVINIVAAAPVPTLDTFHRVWPLVAVTSVAIILVMSFLFHALRALLIEVDEREQMARALTRIDPLTDLSNRRAVTDRLDELARHSGLQSEKFALILIDLDKFKIVNDHLGHQAGDELLRVIAKRLKSLARQEDLVARIGGDEFMIILQSIECFKEVEQFCARIAAAIGEPIKFHEKHVAVGASIGYALADGDLKNGTEYIGRADTALYRAKSRGRNRTVAYSEEMSLEIVRPSNVQEFPRKDVETGGNVFAHVQPQIAADGS